VKRFTPEQCAEIITRLVRALQESGVDVEPTLLAEANRTVWSLTAPFTTEEMATAALFGRAVDEGIQRRLRPAEAARN
jgi:hypothetical protein